MKGVPTAALLAALCSIPLHAQRSVSQEPLRDESALKDQLIAQVDTFMHAWQKQDAAALTATMAPEFLYVSSRGMAPREGIVAALTHTCTLTSYSLTDVRVVAISLDAATLVYKLHQNAICAGHPDPPVVVNTDTLVRRDNKWLFLVTTSTPSQ